MPTPNFRALAAKPDIVKWRPGLSGWRKAAFYTGNVDENDKNFWIPQGPSSHRTAYIRDVRCSLVLVEDKPVLQTNISNISDSDNENGQHDDNMSDFDQ